MSLVLYINRSAIARNGGGQLGGQLGGKVYRIRVNGSINITSAVTSWTPSTLIVSTLNAANWNVIDVVPNQNFWVPGMAFSADIYANVNDGFSDADVVSQLQADLAGVMTVQGIQIVQGSVAYTQPGNKSSGGPTNGSDWFSSLGLAGLGASGGIVLVALLFVFLKK